MTMGEIIKLAGVGKEQLEKIVFSTKRKRATLFLNGNSGGVIKLQWNARKKLVRKEVLQ